MGKQPNKKQESEDSSTRKDVEDKHQVQVKGRDFLSEVNQDHFKYDEI